MDAAGFFQSRIYSLCSILPKTPLPIVLTPAIGASQPTIGINGRTHEPHLSTSEAIGIYVFFLIFRTLDSQRTEN